MAGGSPANGQTRLMARLAALLLCARAASAFDPIPTTACGSSAYFDIDSLLCTGCPSGQRPAASGFACECTGSTVAASAEDIYDAKENSDRHCVECSSGLVPARAYTHPALGGSCLACSEAEQGTADVTLVTANGTTTIGEVTVSCPGQNSTASRPTLGQCTALDTPDDRCPAPTDDGFEECACPAG